KRLCEEPRARHGCGDERTDVAMEQWSRRRTHQQVEAVEAADVRAGRDRAAEATVSCYGTLRGEDLTSVPGPPDSIKIAGDPILSRRRHREDTAQPTGTRTSHSRCSPGSQTAEAVVRSSSREAWRRGAPSARLGPR